MKKLFLGLMASVACVPMAYADGHLKSTSPETWGTVSPEKLLSDLNTPDVRPDRDTFTLKPGATSRVVVTIGSSKTVRVPPDFTRVLVVSPDVADVMVLSQGRVQLLGKAAGDTDLVFSNEKGDTFKAIVSVSLNAKPVQDALNRDLSGQHITASAANGALVLSGVTRDITTVNAAMDIARKFVRDPGSVVNQIQVMGGQQVMLKVQVAEVSRNVIKQLGMNTAFSAQANNYAAGNMPQLMGTSAYSKGLLPFQSGSGTSSTNGGQGLQPLMAMGMAAANPIGYISTKALGSVFTSVASALETEGLVKTLAEPNLVTQSGKTATMMAGQQYPVPQVSQTGVTGTQYKNFGVSMGFTPTVLSPNNIQLQISTEVSTLGSSIAFPSVSGGSYQVPIFNTRGAKSTVELPSGGSIMIAGLLQDSMTNSLSGLPGIKDVPILGKLVSSVSFQRNETELVISVTAYLVQPMDSSKMSSPTDGMTAPSDFDLYFLNRITGIALSRRIAPPPTSVRGNFGYMTE